MDYSRQSNGISKVRSILLGINLAEPSDSLFDSTAEELAKIMAENTKSNKPSQIRKFYDELWMWTEKAKDREKFVELLPLIKMMKAKVAYAKGRELVTEEFSLWFGHCMDRVRSENPEEGVRALMNFRTLFEAFLGFYKVHKSRD